MQTAKWMRKAAVAAAVVSASWAAQSEGLTPTTGDSLFGPRWQTRLTLGSSVPAWRAGVDGTDRPGLKVSGISLMGDYYFSRSAASAGGTASGFRATSGLIVGPRTALWTARPATGWPGTAFSIDRRLFDNSPALSSSDAALDNATSPYVGVGYSGLSLRGGWSVSADLGLVALAPRSAVQLGRASAGTQGVDELLRDLRLSPVIQLGVSYSF